jgi:hypothetical protein
MKKKIVTLLLTTACLLAVPFSTFADTRSYTPPPRKGVIFIVVKLRGYDSSRGGHSTNVSVRWGSYSRSKNFPSVSRSLKITVGVVIRLRHDNNDSVPLTVSTDGQIIQLEQTSRSPSQWNDPNWEQTDW